MWNPIDVFIILIVLLYLSRGWYEGFVRVSLDLLGLALIFWAGLRYHPQASAFLSRQFGLPEVYGRAIGFLLAGVLAASLFWILVGLTFGRLPSRVHRSLPNRLLGLFPAAMAGLLVAALLVTVVSVAPVPEVIAAEVQSSQIGGRLIGWTTQLEGQLRPIFGDAISETLNFLTVRPETDAFLQLPYQVLDPQPAPAVENEMLRLVNEERIKAGLPPLVMDEGLRQVARVHARDMFQRGYFSHYTPDRRSPFDRLLSANIRYLAAGENLALAPTVQAAHRGLMNSPGHRANILSPTFRKIGIGAMAGGLRGIMFSQEFTN
jgi:uncharacterized protein YkwD